MPGQEFFAHGATVTFDSQDIGGLVSIGLPEESRGDVETTNNDSSGSREFVPGLRDGGTITLEARLIPGDAGQDKCRTNYASEDEAKEIVITLPDSANTDSSTTTYTFDAYVSSMGGDLPQADDEPGMWTCTLKVTGAVTVATA